MQQVYLVYVFTHGRHVA